MNLQTTRSARVSGRIDYFSYDLGCLTAFGKLGFGNHPVIHPLNSSKSEKLEKTIENYLSYYV